MEFASGSVSWLTSGLAGAFRLSVFLIKRCFILRVPWWWVQPMSEDEWVGTLDKEVASSSLSTGLEDDFDTELAGAYGDIFSKSIEKLKDASTVRLFVTALSCLVSGSSIKSGELESEI